MALGVAATPKGGRKAHATVFSVALAAFLATAAGSIGPSAAAAPACTITWDGGAGTTGWATPANWDTNVVPGAAASRLHSSRRDGCALDRRDSILSLRSAGALTLSSGTLTLTDTTAGNESNATSIVHSGGTLGGAATLVVSGMFVWSGGTQTDAGTTRIEAGATLAVSGGLGKSLSGGRTLWNEGVVTWSGGSLSLGDGAVVENVGRFEALGDSTISSPGLPESHFRNRGLFAKTGGTGTTSLELPLENDGAVEARSGTLSLAGGGSSAASFRTVGDDALLRFGVGSFSLGDGASLAGRIELAGTTITLAGTVTTAADSIVTQPNGTLAGVGTLLVNGMFVWSGGTQTDAGTTRIEAGATLAVSGGLGKSLSGGRTLWNEGTVSGERGLDHHPAVGRGS